MGISLSIKCRECDYSETLRLGIGMAYYPTNIIGSDTEDTILPSIIKSKTALKHIEMLVTSKGGILSDNYEHKAYHCQNCSNITEQFFLHIDYDGGYYEPAYKCSKCKGKLEIMFLRRNKKDDSTDFSKYTCPDCGKYSLEEDITAMIMWD